MKVALLAAIAVAMVAVACSDSGSQEPPASGETEQLRAAVQAYSDAFLTGDSAAYGMLSERCRNRRSADQFGIVLAGAKSLYGSTIPARSFDAEISGNLARATYTYDISAINQSAEPWVRENGEWKQDDC